MVARILTYGPYSFLGCWDVGGQQCRAPMLGRMLAVWTSHDSLVVGMLVGQAVELFWLVGCWQCGPHIPHWLGCWRPTMQSSSAWSNADSGTSHLVVGMLVAKDTELLWLLGCCQLDHTVSSHVLVQKTICTKATNGTVPSHIPHTGLLFQNIIQCIITGNTWFSFLFFLHG